MKLFRKLWVLVLTSFIALGCFPVTTFAAEANEYGLQVSITTDKKTYSTNEEISLKIVAKNTNEFAVKNVSIESLLPEGLKLKTGQSSKAETVSLEPGKELELDTIAIQDSKPAAVPKTGDNSPIILLLALMAVAAAAGLAAFRYRKNAKKILSVFLCAALIASFTTKMNVHAAEIPAEAKSFSLTHEINVAGKTYKITAKIGYDMPCNLPKITIDKSSFTYDTKNDIYYLYDTLDKISGTLENSKEINKFEYEILNVNNDVIKNGEIEINENWTIPGIGLVLGKNKLRITAITTKNQKITEEITIFNFKEENMNNLDLDKGDNDKEGLINYLEGVYGTDVNNPDTDNDGLTDYQEIAVLGTNPLAKDTDKNGIEDGDEDFDKDGITNKEEFRVKGNPLSSDTDYDGLDDSKELKLGTALDNADTDNDGLKDPQELEIGTSPLNPDTNGNGILDGKEIYNKTFEADKMPMQYDERVIPTVKVSAEGDKLASFNMKVVKDNPMLSDEIPGYIGSAYDLNIDGTFSSATLSFKFNEDLLKNKDFVPAIYYYNEQSNILEEVKNQTINGNTVSAELQHFSTYILLNKTAFEEVWERDIKPPGTPNEAKKTLDIAFVIDSSGSMSWNDSSNIRLDLTKQFIDKLGDDDRGAVIDFDSSSVVQCSFTSDKTALKNAVDMIDSYGGTNIYTGLYNALAEFDKIKTDNDSNKLKIMFLLTDGDDGYSASVYDTLLQKAKQNNIAIYTVGLGEVIEDKLKGIADSTGGKYYYASTATDLYKGFDLLLGETVDYITDSNNDGISDYFTKLMCEGKLVSGTGVKLFEGATYEEIQANDDYDQDGLKNGEEVVVNVFNNQVYLDVISDPANKYSDMDKYSDYQEVNNYDTDPLVSNTVLEQNDLQLLTNDSKYVSNKYKELYESDIEGALERGSIWIGNNVFGSNYDKTLLFKKEIIKYFKKVASEKEESQKLMEAIDIALDLGNGLKSNVEAAMEIVKDSQPAKYDELKSLYHNLSLYRDSLNNMSYNPSVQTKEQFYQVFDAMLKGYDDTLNDVSELKSDIKLTTKALKYAEKGTKVLGIVLNVLEVYSKSRDFIDTYSDFEANMKLMEDNMYILDLIIQNAWDDNLKSAAQEVKKAIQSQYYKNSQKFSDAFSQIGGSVIKIGVEALLPLIPVVGPYIAVVQVALGIGDFIFNISDMAEACVYLYGTASMSSILSKAFVQNVNRYNKYHTSDGKEVIAVYDEAPDILTKYFNLSCSRINSEEEMISAEKEAPWFIEWIFTKIRFNEKDAEKNISDVNSILRKYEFSYIMEN